MSATRSRAKTDSAGSPIRAIASVWLLVVSLILPWSLPAVDQQIDAETGPHQTSALDPATKLPMQRAAGPRDTVRSVLLELPREQVGWAGSSWPEPEPGLAGDPTAPVAGGFLSSNVARYRHPHEAVRPHPFQARAPPIPA